MSARLGVPLVLALALVPGCTCAGDSVNRGDLNLMSLDDEWALGAELAAEVDAQTVALDDEAVQAYADRLGESMAARTEMADRPWTFTVLADPAVNAFALPGGHVYVNAGLIEAAGTEAELASVVGHEVAHVAARHSTERMVKAHGLNLIASLVLSEDAGLLQQLVAGLVGHGALARFSRNDEREADALGQRFMAEAGHDPGAMAAMFETLLDVRERRPLLFERWFQSHPLSEERVEAAIERAAEMEPAPAPEADDFEAIQARVRSASGV